MTRLEHQFDVIYVNNPVNVKVNVEDFVVIFSCNVKAATSACSSASSLAQFSLQDVSYPAETPHTTSSEGSPSMVCPTGDVAGQSCCSMLFESCLHCSLLRLHGQRLQAEDAHMLAFQPDSPLSRLEIDSPLGWVIKHSVHHF